MKKNAITCLLASILVIVGAFVAGIARSTEGEVPPAPPIGTTVEDFTLPDADGNERSLNSLKGKNGSVLIFVATKCPVSNAYNERMEKLAQDFKARGVNVIGINANAAETAAAVKTHAAENHLTFPVLKDQANKIADRLGASVTPEAYFLDGNNKLVYRGRIDNAKEVTNVNSSDLRDAIEATLAGKPVAKTTANAFGCSIKRA
ncbi:MAG: redoxin domain-containing protein [Pyrinomonadaceae bacterium]|nr:redoxin domain-containing protein [Pyrinomonadaceae bacterium]